MRLFFGAHRPRLVLVRIIKTGLLQNQSAIFQNCNLAARLIVDSLLNKAHRVHVFDFAARAQIAKILGGLIFFILTGQTDRHVHISPQIAILHIAVTSTQIA